MNVPILRLELKGMEYSIHAALAEHKARLDYDLQVAIERFCAEDNLAKIIDDQVVLHMRTAIEAAIKDYFVYGIGRTIIKDQVAHHLEQQFK